MLNLTVRDIRSWGKHLLTCFRNFFARIHFLMWGSYRINGRKEAAPGLSPKFRKGDVNFYSCAMRLAEGDPDEIYDWEVDVMSEEWNATRARKALRLLKKTQVCDAVLNQNIFSGAGNIIRNEVLFRTRIHPASDVAARPARKLRDLGDQVRIYSFDFYKWKKALELKKHWLIYSKKKKCPRCNIPAEKGYIGRTARLTCFCNNCQALYA